MRRSRPWLPSDCVIADIESARAAQYRETSPILRPPWRPTTQARRPPPGLPLRASLAPGEAAPALALAAVAVTRRATRRGPRLSPSPPGTSTRVPRQVVKVAGAPRFRWPDTDRLRVADGQSDLAAFGRLRGCVDIVAVLGVVIFSGRFAIPRALVVLAMLNCASICVSSTQPRAPCKESASNRDVGRSSTCFSSTSVPAAVRCYFICANTALGVVDLVLVMARRSRSRSLDRC